MHSGTHKQQARKLNLKQPAYKRHGITNNALQKDFRQYRILLMMAVSYNKKSRMNLLVDLALRKRVCTVSHKIYL